MVTGSTHGSSWGLVGGVDGVRGGWVMAVTGVEPRSPVCISVWCSFADLWCHARERGLLAVAVDIPVGLPTSAGRCADKEARQCLKGPPRRTSSVFPAPPFSTLGVAKYKEAGRLARLATGKGLTRQTHALLPKIEDVRDALKPDAFDLRSRPRAAEVHPEVSFRAMACRPMSFHKSLQAGVAERLVLLEGHFPNIVDDAVRAGITGCDAEGHDEKLAPGLDDVLDAVAAAWTARRLIQGKANRLGGCEKDPDGYPMNIWA